MPENDEGTAETDTWVPAQADAPPTPEEERAAEQTEDQLTDATRAAYDEMTDIGAHVKGEGAIE